MDNRFAEDSIGKYANEAGLGKARALYEVFTHSYKKQGNIRGHSARPQNNLYCASNLALALSKGRNIFVEMRAPKCGRFSAVQKLFRLLARCIAILALRYFIEGDFS